MKKDQEIQKDFVSFLQNEFSESGKKKNSLKNNLLEGQVIGDNSSKSNKKHGSVGKRLAGTSKLIKSIEVFLSNNEEGDVNEEIIKKWSKSYKETNAKMAKEMKKISKSQQVYSERRESGDNLFYEVFQYKVFTYSVVSIIVMIFAISVVGFFPFAANKYISTIESVIISKVENSKLTEKSEESQKNSKEEVVTEKKKTRIDKSKMAEFIRNNHGRLTGKTILINEEQVFGHVAGVEE